MDRNKCVIIVPIYKSKFDWDEYNSINQLFKILGNYDIICIHPQSLDLTYYQNNFNFTDYYQFWDSYFNDYPKGYNSLLLNEGFYECFDKYEYMLIYQPDCWVFRDELEYWINKEYDFIGAPQILRSPYYENAQTFIGNGGFSLRKISAFIYVCKNFKYMINSLIEICDHEIGEDHIFIWLLNSGINIKFNLPNFYESSFFAFDTNPGILYNLTDKKLPFGCHAYKKVIDNKFWNDFICYDKKRYSIVTFLFGDYDKLKDPYIIDETAEYICITDRTDLESNIWRFENITEYDISNYNDWQKTLIARYTVLNHITTDQCIIVDASIQIKKSLSKFIDLNSINDVGFVIHPFRESYLDEFDEWIKTRDLDYQQKEDFINFCNKHAFDYNNAKCFIMSTVMFIRKTDTTISLFNTVLNELMNNYDFSIRIDQLYLSVIFFRYYPEIIREYYSYQILNSDYFSYHYHNSELTHEGDYDYDLSKLEIRNVYYKNSLCKYLT